MSAQRVGRQSILVLDDIEETRNLLQKMLGESRCCVALAKDEEDAILSARSQSPDVILMSLGLDLENLIATAQRIREEAAFGQDVAIVIFCCVPTIPEGAEMEVNKNVYVTRPDNFDQLRDLLHRLLRNGSSSC